MNHLFGILLLLAVSIVTQASQSVELKDEDAKLAELENQLRELVHRDEEYAMKELKKRIAEVALMKLLGKDKRTVVNSGVCIDAERESKEGLCKMWHGLGACKAHVDVMRLYCRKTCDLCKPPAPPVPNIPDCAYTKYGCCWDNKTVALGEHGHGCIPCFDRGRKLCITFADDCSSRKKQGTWMRENCPQICKTPCDYNLNVNRCKDDPAYASYCEEWMQEGKCDKDKEKMQVLCRNTCGLCKTLPIHGNFLG